MGLFDKKFCDICGEKISFLGNRKLEDGNMCGTCAKKISPFFSGRRKTTVADMKEHLAYRESNRLALAGFAASETYGEGKKLYIDRQTECFAVSFNAPGSWEKENPDVIPLREVTSCKLDIRENREEEFTEDEQGKKTSFTPPRYKFYYDFEVKMELSSRWFSDLEIKLNSSEVEGLNSQKYHDYELMGAQMVAAVTGEPLNITPANPFATANAAAKIEALNNKTQAAAPAVTANAAAKIEALNSKAQAAAPAVTANAAAKIEALAGKSEAAAELALKEQYLQQIRNGWAMEMVCPNCRKTVTTKFCPDCGGQAVAKAGLRCSACGADLSQEGGSKFCPNCGHQIGAEDVILR